MNTEFPTSFQNTQDRVFAKYDSLVAQVAAGGVTVETSALFDLDGNWTPAKLIQNKYGYSWLVLDANGKSTGVFVPYASKNRETQAKRGFVEGKVRVAAQAILAGGFRPTASLIPAKEDLSGTPVEIITVDRWLETK